MTLRYRTIVVKLGTNVLTGGKDRLDLDIISALADEVATLAQRRVRTVIVSSGAIAAGREALGLPRLGRYGIANLQVLAAVGQSRLMQVYEQIFSGHGIIVGQALLTRPDLDSKRTATNARRALLGMLELGVIPIVNENDVTATDEIGRSFGDNDNLSAAVANLLDADLLVLLTDQDGLYDSDPRTNPDAKLIPHVARVTDAIRHAAAALPSEGGRGGMASKINAAAEATSWGTAVVIAGGRVPGVLTRAVSGESAGTFFVPWGARRTTERRRSMGGVFVRGSVVVDDGAANRLRGGRSSLLPVGVTEVRGAFRAGDIVEILEPGGIAIARGIVNYPAETVNQVKGRRSAEIRALLSASADGTAGDEIVHLDNLVLLP
ncbi:MAG: glutamate 5-kinase [Chloroflexi bacterium]|nr:glutamate 5-kinase [Chloroflexota bacterium]